MKNYLILFICFLGFISQANAQIPVDKKATKETVWLLNKL